jgi:putative transposase
MRMAYDPEVHHRRSIRLRGYDYSQPGHYYVTICTQAKEHLFGHIVEGDMHRSELGDYAARCWEWLAQQYAYIDLDEWIVMPNHLHGIIVITDRRSDSGGTPGTNGKAGGASRSAPTTRKPLGRLVGAFKTVSTDRINERRGTPARLLWQRDFYDHIIRDDDELNKIREYIRTNQLRWKTDPENV